MLNHSKKKTIQELLLLSLKRILKKRREALLYKYNKRKKISSKSFIKLVIRYRYYLYVLSNKIITKQVEFRNILKIKFTKSNVFPSIFVKTSSIYYIQIFKI